MRQKPKNKQITREGSKSKGRTKPELKHRQESEWSEFPIRLDWARQDIRVT